MTKSTETDELESGLYLVCNPAAEIIEVLFDDLSLIDKSTLPQKFISLFDEGSVSKAGVFWKNIQHNTLNLDSELLVKRADKKSLPLKFSGGIFNNQIWVIAALRDEVLELMFDELMRINNEQQNLIRLAEKKLSRYANVEFSGQNLFDEISRVNNELVNAQRKLVKQNEQILRLNKELQDTNRELEHFAYALSHDLKEPLRMVRSFMRLLRQRYTDKLDEKGRQYIHFAEDGAERMNKLIHDLLEYSRVGRKGITVEQTNVNVVMEEVLHLNRSIVHATNATIRYVNLPTITCRKVPFQQLLNNLVANSLKYRRDAVPLQIEVTGREEKDHWLFAVSDNGLGIDSEHHTAIFDLFRRVHKDKDVQGSGMGLAFCKKIVQDHGGKIWVESKVGQGSTFYFTISRPVQ